MNLRRLMLWGAIPLVPLVGYSALGGTREEIIAMQAMIDAQGPILRQAHEDRRDPAPLEAALQAQRAGWGRLRGRVHPQDEAALTPVRVIDLALTAGVQGFRTEVCRVHPPHTKHSMADPRCWQCSGRGTAAQVQTFVARLEAMTGPGLRGPRILKFQQEPGPDGVLQFTCELGMMVLNHAPESGPLKNRSS